MVVLSPMLQNGPYIPFEKPIVAPSSDALNDPLMSVCFNADWLPLVEGSLKVLCRPETYKGTQAEIEAAMASGQNILANTQSGCSSEPNCPNWYLDFGHRFNIDQSRNRWFFNVDMDVCEAITQFFVGHAPETIQVGSLVYGLEIAGYDYASSNFAGGKIVTMVIRAEQIVTGNVFSIFIEDCLGQITQTDTGLIQYVRSDFEAKAVAIVSLAPFTVAFSIAGNALCVET